MNIHLSISEGQQILSCLKFVEDNLAFDCESLRWHFVPGNELALTIRELAELSVLRGHVSASLDDAIERHPFNPYIKVF